MKFEVTKIEMVECDEGQYYHKVHLKFEDGTTAGFQWNPEEGPLTKRKLAKEARELYNRIRGAYEYQRIEAERIEQSKRFVGKKFTART